VSPIDFHERRGPGLSRNAWIAIGVVAAAHLGVGAALYYQRFELKAPPPASPAPANPFRITLEPPPNPVPLFGGFLHETPEFLNRLRAIVHLQP